MYKCKNCRAIFEEPETYREQSGEKWNMCPFCESTDISILEAPKEIEPLEISETAVRLIAAYNMVHQSKEKADTVSFETLDEAVDSLRNFVCDTVRDIDLYADLKACKTVGNVGNIIDYIYKVYELKGK
jgi:hypothetical protein